MALAKIEFEKWGVNNIDLLLLFILLCLGALWIHTVFKRVHL